MSGISRDELRDDFAKLATSLAPGASSIELLAAAFYQPDPELPKYLDRLEKSRRMPAGDAKEDAIRAGLVKAKVATEEDVADVPKAELVDKYQLITSRERGYLLEYITCLIFKGLKTGPQLRWLDSAGGQYDLIADCAHYVWPHLTRQFGMGARTGIIVEAKCETKPPGHPYIARLAGLLAVHAHRAGMALLVSPLSISGSGTPSKPSAAYLACILQYARTGRPIIYFDSDDLDECRRPGGLIHRLVLRAQQMADLPKTLLSPGEDSDELPKTVRDVLQKLSDWEEAVTSTTT